VAAPPGAPPADLRTGAGDARERAGLRAIAPREPCGKSQPVRLDLLPAPSHAGGDPEPGEGGQAGSRDAATLDQGSAADRSGARAAGPLSRIVAIAAGKARYPPSAHGQSLGRGAEAAVRRVGAFQSGAAGRADA